VELPTEMRNDQLYWITLGLMLVFVGVVLTFVSVYGAGDKLLCDRIMYSDNWTLGYLRNVSSICSNGM